MPLLRLITQANGLLHSPITRDYPLKNAVAFIARAFFKRELWIESQRDAGLSDEQKTPAVRFLP